MENLPPTTPYSLRGCGAIGTPSYYTQHPTPIRHELGYHLPLASLSKGLEFFYLPPVAIGVNKS
jgi:hypothetical protein